jgi:polyhydroxyalkanoate synthesis regulator phasin
VNTISVTKEAQRSRLLKALLEHGELSTDDARTVYAAMSPASRIMELRKAGHRIRTVYRTVADAQGVLHKMGVYVLVSEGTL